MTVSSCDRSGKTDFAQHFFFARHDTVCKSNHISDNRKRPTNNDHHHNNDNQQTTKNKQQQKTQIYNNCNNSNNNKLHKFTTIATTTTTTTTAHWKPRSHMRCMLQPVQGTRGVSRPLLLIGCSINNWELTVSTTYVNNVRNIFGSRSC